MRWLCILAVLAYRALIRPFYRRVCLFEESCSTYAIRTLRHEGAFRAVPMIRARVHSCRMPAGACFLIGADGAAKLLSATSSTAAPVPPGALAFLAAEAERATSHRHGGPSDRVAP